MVHALQAGWPTVAQLSADFRSGRASPIAITEAYLDRIARVDPQTGAFQLVCANMAQAAAVEAERRISQCQSRGPLDGVPFAVKDVFDVAGMPTTGGSALRQGHIASRTAPVVQRLLNAGGVLLGKTRTVEIAFGGLGTNQVMGTPHNPWDWATARVPGGSSSGSAVALAADLVPCALGSDTGGSIRLPSAFCGVAGLKVGEGRLPTEGLLPLSHTLDTVGPMARSVLDLLILLQVMEGRDGGVIHREMTGRQGDFAMLDAGVAGLTLGILPEVELAGCSAEVREGYRAALDRFDVMGARLKPFRLPLSLAALARDNGRLIAAEAWHHHGAIYADPKAQVDEDVRPRVLAGKDISPQDREELLTHRETERGRFLEAMQSFDALLTPTTQTTALSLSEIDQNLSPAYFTRPVNYLGLCAVSVPAGLSPEGLPIGLQVVARGAAEILALRIAAAFEANTPPLDRRRCADPPGHAERASP